MKKRGFCGICVAQSLIFCVVICRSLFVLFCPFPFVIMLSVLRFAVFDYPFGIIELFFYMITDIFRAPEYTKEYYIVAIILDVKKKSIIYPRFLMGSLLLIFIVVCAFVFVLCLACQCCQCLLIVYFWLALRFSLTFIYIIKIYM